MDAVFKALADASRRHLLDSLHGQGGQTLRQLSAGLTMTRQAVSKHLAVLEAAGLVNTVRRGREKLHYLNSQGIEHLREANPLLPAAMDPAQPSPYRLALDRLLAAHDPYPALVLDRRCGVVAANRGALMMFGDRLVGTILVWDGCPVFVIGGTVVRTIAVVARFDPATDVPDEDLRVELLYPGDRAAERFFRTAEAVPA